MVVHNEWVFPRGSFARSEAAAIREASAPPDANPFCMFGTYSSAAGETQTDAIVRTGRYRIGVFGYLGPAAAAPGYDLDYLNVKAGPGSGRVWKISNEPAQAWIRRQWVSQSIDPRLLYTAGKDTNA